VVGGQAYQQYRRDLEEEGEVMGRFMRSLKSHLGSDLGTYINSRRYTLTDLVSVMLKEASTLMYAVKASGKNSMNIRCVP